MSNSASVQLAFVSPRRQSRCTRDRWLSAGRLNLPAPALASGPLAPARTVCRPLSSRLPRR
eukprot:2397497-Prymnesium_polylepis.1